MPENTESVEKPVDASFSDNLQKSSIRDLPLEEKKRVIDDVYQEVKSGNFKDNEKNESESNIEIIADILTDLNVAESSPIIKQFLELDRNINKIAFAKSVKNWSASEVNQFLDGVRFTEAYVGGLGAGKRQPKDNLDKLRFKLAYLGETENELDQLTETWISEGISQTAREKNALSKMAGAPDDFSKELITIFRERPELVSKYADMATVSSSDLSKYILDEIGSLSIEEQYNYIQAFANYYCWDFPDISKISQWDLSHQRKLIKHMLATEGSKSILAATIAGNEEAYDDDEYNDEEHEDLSFALPSPSTHEKALILLADLPFDMGRFDDELVQILFANVYSQQPFKFESSRRKFVDTLRHYAKERPEEVKSMVVLWSLDNPKYEEEGSSVEKSPFEELDVEGFDDLAELSSYLPTQIRGLTSIDHFESIDHFYQFVASNKEFIDFITSQPGELRLTPEHFALIEAGSLPFGLLETEVLLREGIEVDNMGKNDALCKKAWEVLKESSYVWMEDETAVLGQFERGAEIFGYRKMFKYANSERVNHHDALHGFDNILELHRASGLKAKAFYGNVLFQVLMDNAQYDEGTAYHRLNSIANTLDRDIDARLDEARQFAEEANLETLQSFNERFNSPQAVFESWGNLKLYSERVRILEEREFLTRLSQLRNEGKDALADYVEQLMFHKDSKISAGAIEQFLLDPQGFLDQSDQHTPEEVQDRKKPSNYIYIPNLDLTADQLRDALVEKKLDGIQVFSPMKANYYVPIIDGQYILDTRELIAKTVPQNGGNEAIAQLRSQIQQIVGAEDVDLADFFTNKRQLSPDALNKIKEVFIESPVADTVNWQQFIVEIHKKSDPKAAIAGDDTVNCMPFGAGKSTVYTFNLNTAQLTLQAQNGSEQYRTVAQSVLTKDRDVKRNVPDIVNDLSGGDTHLPDILPQDVLSNARTYIACDNIEVAPNWEGDFEYVIEALYADFFQRYLEMYAEDQHIDNKKVVIGMGYADAMKYLPTESNTYIPQAPVGYSDKTGEHVYTLSLEQKSPAAVFIGGIEQSDVEMIIPGERSTSAQVSFLTYEDSLAVGYIEGKSYADNPQMIQNLHNMENALIAMQINNVDKGRPHMSLKYQDADGNIRGYMLAYEGRMGSSYEDQEDEEQRKEDELIVYIADLASDKESQTAGGRLITSFLDLYQKNYLGKDDLVPLYMEAREKTSYRIIQRQLDKIGNRLGIQFELEELDNYQEGGDTMHPIILRPTKV